MSDNEGRGVAPGIDQAGEGELTPVEKLEGQPATGPLPPGIEDPYNDEVKQEKSPNTE